MADNLDQTEAEAPRPRAPLNLIDQTLGDFRILGVLGSGGMGDVYLAEQNSLKRRVALKVLRQDLVNDENYLRRFYAEAKAVAPISHPNIVSVYGIGEENGIHYIVLEYVQGITLREHIKRKGRLDYDETLAIMTRVAAALERAGEEGIIHRDIKPENVMVTKKNEVKVMDFGLARQLTAEDMNLTQTGVTMGTPLYMSPEQLQGQPLDHRTDIYSFGILCYHMIAGRPPYAGDIAVTVALQHVSGKATPLRELRSDFSAELIAIVEKMMAKRPQDRYQSARALLADLERLRAGLPMDANLIGAFEPGDTPIAMADASGTSRLSNLGQTLSAVTEAFREPQRRPWAIAASMLLVLGAGLAFGWTAREPDLFADSAHSPAASPPQLSAKEKKRTSFLQLLYARLGPPEERDARFWGVLSFYPAEVPEYLDAAFELMTTYLANHRYESALELANELTLRDNEDQKMIGHLFRGIVESRMGKVEDAQKSFEAAFTVREADEFSEADEVALPADQHEWLARHYVLAARKNGGSETAAVAEFDRHFRVQPRFPR